VVSGVAAQRAEYRAQTKIITADISQAVIRGVTAVSADFFFFFSCLRDELSKPGRHFLVCVVNGNARF
jgi:hypothetical protein